MKKTKIATQYAASTPSFGSVYRVKGSGILYVSFYYKGERLRLSTNLDDTPANRELVCKFLNSSGEAIKRGTFCFTEAFPGADLELKEHFAKLEGKNFNPPPEHVVFREFAEKWMKRWLETAPDTSKRDDYEGIYKYRLLPYFAEMPFSRLTNTAIEDFCTNLKWAGDKNRDKPLSMKRIKNILIVLKRVWEAACDEYQWTLRDPFRTIHKKLSELQEARLLEEDDDTPEEEYHPRLVFLPDEWRRVLASMDPHYHPVAEIMLMTGLIGSELRGLKKTDLVGNTLRIQRKISKQGKLIKKLKSKYRHRDVPVTKAIRKRLDMAMATSSTEFVFCMKDGSAFCYSKFYKQIWCRSVRKAGLDHRVAYATRHTLVAWALVAGMVPTRLISITGHGDKGMIFRVYGNYRPGLVEARREILEYLGHDFLTEEEWRMVTPGGLLDEKLAV